MSEPALQKLSYMLSQLEAHCASQGLPAPVVRFQTPKELRYQYQQPPAELQADGTWLLSWQEYALHGYAGVLPEVWREEINQLDLAGHTALSDFIDVLAQRGRELAGTAAKQAELTNLLRQNDEQIEQIFEFLLQLKQHKSLPINEQIKQQLGIKVRFNYDHGIWCDIPAGQQTQLSADGGSNCQLGENAVLGSRYLDTTDSVLVTMQAQDSAKEAALRKLLEELIAAHYRFEIQIEG